MRKRTNTDIAKERAKVAKAEGRAYTKDVPFYVVECEAGELPEVYERRHELIKAGNDGDQRIFNGRGAEWYGGISSWEEAKRVLVDGWPEGAEMARGLAADIAQDMPEPESAVRRPTWGEDGDEIDRDRLYAGGIDTAWRTTTKVTRRRPRIIRIVGNWAMNAGTSAEQIAWNGAQFVALADLLENAGYGTEVSLAFPTHHYSSDGHYNMPVVRVKVAGEALNLSNMAAVAGHAGIYRSYGFLLNMSSEFRVQYGLGSCQRVKDAWATAVASGVLEAVDVTVEQAYSREGAARNLRQALHQLFPHDMPHPVTGKVQEYGEPALDEFGRPVRQGGEYAY